MLFPFFFFAFFVFVIIMIIRAVVRSASGSGGPRRPSLNVSTQLGQDGFWMFSCPADPGSIIYYHYSSGGTSYSGQVPFKPDADGRQFVYTGRRPDQVSVIRIVAMDEDGLTAPLTPPIIAAASTWDPPDTFSTPTPPSSPAPASFPSAY